MPSITLCLPIYNAERFLSEAIRSIRAQTFEDFEVIAVLDGCTDRSEEILIAEKDERFRVVKKERNEGVVAASNLVIGMAVTPFCGRMDADDVMHPRRLERQVTFLADHPDVDVVGTWFDYIDEQGHSVGGAFEFPATHEDIKNGFRVRNSMGGSSVLFRSERMRAIGGYTDQDPYAEDLNLWLKCLANDFRLANIPEVLMHYRVHENQLSKRNQAETWAMTNLAYKRYGRQIWGDDAPVFELGAPIHRRIMKKVKRIVTGKG